MFVMWFPDCLWRLHDFFADLKKIIKIKPIYNTSENILDLRKSLTLIDKYTISPILIYDLFNKIIQHDKNYLSLDVISSFYFELCIGKKIKTKKLLKNWKNKGDEELLMCTYIVAGLTLDLILEGYALTEHSLFLMDSFILMPMGNLWLIEKDIKNERTYKTDTLELLSLLNNFRYFLNYQTQLSFNIAYVLDRIEKLAKSKNVNLIGKVYYLCPLDN